MSRKRKDMHQLQELVRLHRLGTGAREVARLLGMSPNTEREYRRAFQTAGLLEGPAEELPAVEALALDVLREAGIPPAATTLVEGGGRLFMEVDRFDRTARGRRGLVSLRALGACHGGPGTSWTAEARFLLTEKVLSAATIARILLLDRFGALIGNTDRHHGNLSFFFEEGRLGALCPVYDMVPMGLAPLGMEARPPRLDLPRPDAHAPALWRQATALASPSGPAPRTPPGSSRRWPRWPGSCRGRNRGRGCASCGSRGRGGTRP